MKRIGPFRLLCFLLAFSVILLPAKAAQSTAANQVSNILLVGRDDYAGTDRCRSDSIILCTFRAGSNKLTMTSILRDLYVPIPGHRSNRINAAYALGGMELLEQTVEETFDITLDGSAVVDFTRFPQLIDLLGGGTLELRADEAEAINHRFPGSAQEGLCRLNGDQALAYVRIRKLDDDGDFSRTDRQRKLLQALLDAYRNATLPQILQLLPEALSLVETNMDKRQLMKTVKTVLPALPSLQVTQQHIPAPGTYRYRTLRGMCVLVADLEAAKSLLRQTISPSRE